MFNKSLISSIRILPSDKITFPTKEDFKYFISSTMRERGGIYYFTNSMMKCPSNTLVLFQYSGSIEAIGILEEAVKEEVENEKGEKYAGYYKFDVSTLTYLDTPIDKNMITKIYPAFKGFSQSKQILPLDILDALMDIIIKSDHIALVENNVKEIDDSIESSQLLGEERKAYIKIRVNQSIFRDQLLNRYQKCCLCGVMDKAFLIASHIKPWCDSTLEEKLNTDNGFLLCPNHDKLFDLGYISFDDNGKIIISDSLSKQDAIFMNVQENMMINLTDGNKKFLKFHRENILKK